MARTILVTGAACTVGSEVAKSLLDLDMSIRVGVRQPKLFDTKHSQSVKAAWFKKW